METPGRRKRRLRSFWIRLRDLATRLWHWPEVGEEVEEPDATPSAAAPVDGEPGGAPPGHPASPGRRRPGEWLERLSGGPPRDWMERVREGAPELLHPSPRGAGDASARGAAQLGGILPSPAASGAESDVAHGSELVDLSPVRDEDTMAGGVAPLPRMPPSPAAFRQESDVPQAPETLGVRRRSGVEPGPGTPRQERPASRPSDAVRAAESRGKRLRPGRAAPVGGPLPAPAAGGYGNDRAATGADARREAPETTAVDASASGVAAAGRGSSPSSAGIADDPFGGERHRSESTPPVPPAALPPPPALGARSDRDREGDPLPPRAARPAGGASRASFGPHPLSASSYRGWYPDAPGDPEPAEGLPSEPGRVSRTGAPRTCSPAARGVFEVDSPGEPLEARRGVAEGPQDPWPELPEDPEPDPLDGWDAALRGWERLQRLEREQRGVLWSA